MDQAIKV